MCQSSLDTIISAQARLMNEHDVSSQTALGLLVWAATASGVTVLEVALDICDATPVQQPNLDRALLATAS
jgi:hypothetical protein